MFDRWTCPWRMRSNLRVHTTRSLDGPTTANNDDLLRQLVSWSLTSLFSTNMAISETNLLRQTAALIKKKKYITSLQSACKDRSTKIQQ